MEEDSEVTANLVEIQYRIGSQDETWTSLQEVGGQDDLKANNWDGTRATELEAWALFEKNNPSATVIGAKLLTDQ
jgi:hypothetical protein